GTRDGGILPHVDEERTIATVSTRMQLQRNRGGSAGSEKCTKSRVLILSCVSMKLMDEVEKDTLNTLVPVFQQMWKLNPNGTMVNSYSGLCAIAEFAKDDISPGGIRSWIAKGRR
ncbi:hypothetical protein S83_008766, partial [Arachis hypogaea]